MAGSSVTQTHHTKGRIHKFVFDCVGDDTNGTMPATAITDKFEGRLLALETNPGETGPTADYDITLVDGEGHDVLEGVGADRHTSTTQKVVIVYSGKSLHPVVDTLDTLTLTIAATSVNDATVKIILYYTPSI